jgi:hypothetical protein
MPESEFAALLRELEETLRGLKKANVPEQRRLLLREMRRLFSEIERAKVAPK